MPKSITNTLPEYFNEFDHSPENEQRFKEIQRSKFESEGSEVLLESLKEDDIVTTEADDEASNKSDPVLVQLVEYPELNPKPAEKVMDEAEFSGYNNPDYIKWKNEQKANVAGQLIKKKAVKKTEVSNAKMQKSKLINNQYETKQSKGKSVITTNDKPKAQIVKTDKPVKKKVSKGKTIKFVSAGTFDMNASYGNQINSSIKSNSGLKTGSGPKTSAVNDKRFESKKVNSFKTRALMVRNQKFENNLDPKLEERFIALKRKQTTQAVGRNSFQPNLSNETNFQNLHYQQVRPRRPINSWFVDSGCSRHMTGNHALLQDFKLKNGTHVAFGGDDGGKITGEGTVSNGISFDKVNYYAQLNFNLLSVSQICDKSYSTLFDDSFCYILKPGFKIDNEWVVVKAPRDRDIYKLDMSQIDAETETTCLIAHASNDESQLWHRRLGHSNFRNMNRLVTGNHAVGIPSKKFSTTDLCPACLKGKQHRMSFKSKPENSISKPLQMLHKDLLGPTNVKSIGKKSYCFVIIDDFTNFLGFISCMLNLKLLKKGIARQFSAPRTHKQNGVAERKSRKLIEAARSMLADAKIPITFWDEAIATACFSKSDDGLFLGYSSVSKAYRVFHSKTNTVIETINVKFLENSFPSVAHGLEWLFDLDSLSKSFNFNLFDFSGKSRKESGDLGCFSDDSHNDDDSNLNSEYPFMSFHNPDHGVSNQAPGPSGSQEDQESNNFGDEVNTQNSPNDGGSAQNQPSSDPNVEVVPESFNYFINSPEQVPNFTPHASTILQDLPNLNQSNLETQVQGDSIPTHRVHRNHPLSQIIGPLNQRTMRS
ncbi:hypothetical protein QVD17_38273 [Tagetes erecta]|uniref:Integrase catalytic domain-containing protein n=1 Tax=Tagetes erecta TaxID=13708 RepID=A0AAD8JXM0_TARER|nr:hypothetical protein QVD17_38273 [Tagetes erecta]